MFAMLYDGRSKTTVVIVIIEAADIISDITVAITAHLLTTELQKSQIFFKQTKFSEYLHNFRCFVFFLPDAIAVYLYIVYIVYKYIHLHLYRLSSVLSIDV